MQLHSAVLTALSGPFFRTSRHPLLILSIIFGLHICCAASPAATQEPSKFEITQATLREAAARAADVLHCRVALELYPSNPAHKARVSLSMAVKEPGDLLTALAAAFGVRWLDGSKPGEVVFVDKQEYEGTEAGLRHSIAEAMPAEFRPMVLSPVPHLKSPQALEQGLKDLEDRAPDQLSLVSANGWARVRDLDPAIARPMLEFLAGQNARQFLRAFQPLVQFMRKDDLKAPPLFHYNPPGNGPTFNFRLGQHEFGVSPGA